MTWNTLLYLVCIRLSKIINKRAGKQTRVSQITCNLPFNVFVCNVQNLHTYEYHNLLPVIAKYFHAHKFSDDKTPQSLPPARYVLLSMSLPQANITQMTASWYVSQFTQFIQSHIFSCDTCYFLTFSWHLKKKKHKEIVPVHSLYPSQLIDILSKCPRR